MLPSIARYVIPARFAAAAPMLCPVNPPTLPVQDGHASEQWIVYRQRPSQRPVTFREPQPGQPFRSSSLNRASSSSGGGSGLGTALLVLVGVALAVKLAGPVLGAVGELVHVLLVAVFIIAGAGAAGVVTLLALKWRGPRADAARTMPPLRQKMVRAASPLPQERRAAQLPAESHVNYLAAFIFTSMA